MGTGVKATVEEETKRVVDLRVLAQGIEEKMDSIEARLGDRLREDFFDRQSPWMLSLVNSMTTSALTS